MEEVACWICAGSNCEQEKNFAYIHHQLTYLYGKIYWGTLEKTVAIGFQHNRAPFWNQVACFFTNKPLESLQKEVKQIEFDCGRFTDDKIREIVRMDIDILIFDNIVLKRDDLLRSYIINGMKEVMEKLKNQ